jgi:hypothetical protein
MVSEPAPLGEADRALLDRVARRVIELHLEVPAILALETSRPLTVIAGQTLIFFEPFVQAMFRLPDYRRFAALIERREVMEELMQRIERGAEEQRARRDAARKAARRGGGGA